MELADAPRRSRTARDRPSLLLGGYAALAQSAWMGFAQASEVVEQLRAVPGAIQRARVDLPRRSEISWSGLLTREFTVAEASFILMASFFLSAGLGAVRQVLFNAQFGVGVQANAYYAAFRLPDTLFSLVAGGALSSAMIPVLLNARREEGEAAGWQLVSLVLTTLLAFFALLVLAVEAFTPAFVSRLLAPGFDGVTRQLTIALTRVMLVQPLILAVGSVATAVLNSRNQFLLTGLSIISHNVALILGIGAARLFPSMGIYGPTLGVVGGAVLQVLILRPGLQGPGRVLRLAWNLADVRLRQVIRLLIPNGLSVGVNYAGFIVDTALATRAPEMAGLAAIYNAFLLVGLPIALLGQAVGQAVFPRLARHAEAEDWAAMRRTVFQSLGAVIALALPAMLALITLGRPTIRVLFERGQFTAAAGDLTYALLVIYSLALPAYVATEVVTRGLIALQDTRTPLLINTGQLLGRALLITLLLSTLGVRAIPTAFGISASVEAITLTSFLLVRMRSLALAVAPSQAGPSPN